ncbi:vacuolar membrane protein-domain-containing protein [Limtongia smithiae]|uniref:vacuolar membrane protein-domain-containing protein n=1 Tax=Limtongia smithiae TaxID=1125753 RepID=UPI0034CDA826
MDNQCQLLGPFALVVQGAMGGLAVLSLVYKRYHEEPRRPVLVWTFDVSKQVLGASGIHVMNLFLSILSSASKEEAPTNPCNWYFLNILLDTTIGVPILWFFLTVISRLVRQVGVTGTRSGEYGTPPQFSSFMRQAVMYFLGLSMMKFMVYVLLAVLPFWDALAGFLLAWAQGHERTEVAFVMLVFPLIMNMVQYYLVDSIIKARRPASAYLHGHGEEGDVPEVLFEDEPVEEDAILVDGRR